MSADPSTAAGDAAALEAVIARIPVLETPPRLPEHPDALAALADWWTSFAEGRPVAPADVSATSAAGSVAAALTAGVRAADSAVDAGASLLLPRVPPSDGLAARTVIAVLTRTDASIVTHQPPGMADAAWMDEAARVRDLLRTAAAHRGDPLGLLEALDATGIAFGVGALLGAAARRTPSVIDGVDESAAALVADRLAFRARPWWRGASTCADPAVQAAFDRLDISPGLPLGIDPGRRLGSRATIALLRLAIDEEGA